MFWYNNPYILIDKNYILDIFPHNNYSLEDKLNSIMRFSIYYSVICSIIKYKSNVNNKLLVIPIVVGIITILVYKKSNHIYYINNINNINNNDNNDNCRAPTKDNPFMNPLVSDFGKETSPHCNYKDQKVDDYFHEDLFKDSNDIFNKKNSQRQFFTMPLNGTIPDQGKFANWLYKVPSTCKEGNAENCMNAGRINASPAPSSAS